MYCLFDGKGNGKNMENNFESNLELDNSINDATHSQATYFVFDWVKAVLVSVVLVVLVMTFLFRIVIIDGSSMENTLLNADKAIITTFNYKPQDGDIVAIAHGGNLNKTIIKRVIATEGQTIEFDFDNNKAQVIVDGVILDEPYIKNLTTEVCDWDIPDVIPEGYVFVMGDNREASLDSRRSAVGLINVDDIIGKAEIIIAPFDRVTYLY